MTGAATRRLPDDALGVAVRGARARARRATAASLGAMAALLAAPASALAQDCGAAVTQRALDACEHERFLAAQAPMAEAYRALADALAPGPRDVLRREQKAWLAWRTAACDFEASGVAGGSAAPTVRARCATRLTQERTDALRRRLDCPEGDLACAARRK
jgi:uncharacterized protein YecT (DUF1311 family)